MSQITINPEDEKQKLKAKLLVLKNLLKECENNEVKIWLRDKINELLIELI
jgi:hypothetical protein